jgi:tetratricopeptide (TPR) repeat protein
MPRADSSNNAHVATTNHRIPRHKPAGVEVLSSIGSEFRPGTSLIHFHRDLLDERERLLTERDRGMALCRKGGEVAAREALPLLEAAVAARPDDLAALERQGEVLGRLLRSEEGLAAYKLVLAREATRQTGLEGAAHLACKAGRHEESVEFWKRAVLVNPWRSDFHADMALAAIQIRDWSTASEASRQALRLNPNLLQVRRWLVQSELRPGDIDAARREFELLLEFDRPDRDGLLRRFGCLAAPR